MQRLHSRINPQRVAFSRQVELGCRDLGILVHLPARPVNLNVSLLGMRQSDLRAQIIARKIAVASPNLKRLAYPASVRVIIPMEPGVRTRDRTAQLISSRPLDRAFQGLPPCRMPCLIVGRANQGRRSCCFGSLEHAIHQAARSASAPQIVSGQRGRQRPQDQVLVVVGAVDLFPRIAS